MHTIPLAADRLRGGAGALALALLTTAATADRLAVPAEYPTIQAAVDAATDGDEIDVAPGTYQRFAAAGKAISIRGTAGPAQTIIDGNGTGPAVELAAPEGAAGPTISGFTVRGGACENGAGLYLSGRVTVENVIVTANTATNGGGAFISGTPSLRNVRFHQNHAINGGAVFVAQDAAPVFEACTFEANTATFGGAIHVGPRGFGQTSATFIDCTIASNTAERGGGVAVYDATLQMLGGAVANNTASRAGGGIDLTADALAELTGGELRSNTAPEGAAVFASRAAIGTITDAVIHRNTSTTGGVIRATDAELYYGDSRLYANAPANASGASTDIGGNIFSAPPCSIADMAATFGQHDINDVLAFVSAFGARSAEADLSPVNNTFDINDILAFAVAFVGSCRQ